MKSGRKQYAVGVDFGGTSVKLALVNAQGKIVERCKFATAEAAGQAAWLEAVAVSIALMLKACGLKKSALAGVGVGVPGFVDFEKGFIHDLTAGRRSSWPRRCRKSWGCRRTWTTTPT